MRARWLLGDDASGVSVFVSSNNDCGLLNGRDGAMCSSREMGVDQVGIYIWDANQFETRVSVVVKIVSARNSSTCEGRGQRNEGF